MQLPVYEQVSNCQFIEQASNCQFIDQVGNYQFIKAVLHGKSPSAGRWEGPDLKPGSQAS